MLKMFSIVPLPKDNLQYIKFYDESTRNPPVVFLSSEVLTLCIYEDCV